MSSVPPWLWADVGFDTTKKLWFVNLFDHKGTVRSFIAKNIILKDGYGIQYEWPEKERAHWHVRERLFAADVRSIDYDQKGNLIVESIRVEEPEAEIPQDYSYLAYAYSLRTSRGFVEFYDKNDIVLKRINEKWIVVEGLTRRTIGEYPYIRIRVEKSAIQRVVVTKTMIIIQG